MFEQGPKAGEPNNTLGILRLEQFVHHIEHKQGAHAVVGESLPHFRAEEKGQAARMAEEVSGGNGGWVGNVGVLKWGGYHLARNAPVLQAGTGA